MSKRFCIMVGLIALLALVAAIYVYDQHWRGNANNQTPVDEPGLATAVGPLTADEIQRRAAAVYDRGSLALARVEHESGKLLGGDAAVIVTADGYLVHRGIGGGGKRTFHLSDARRVTGSLLGWSEEWGIGLAKLDGPGPWPHVELADSAVQAGHCVVTLGYPAAEDPKLFPQPLLNVEGVTGSAVGRWFVVKDEKTTRWRNAPAVFDLDGRLVGVGWLRNVGAGLGTIYVDAKVVRSLWDDLAAGKNLDELRLRGAVRAEDTVPPAKKAIPPDVEAKVTVATVRIREHPKDRGFSGTIVSADGLVVTCAHGFDDFVMPGTKITVCTPDGRDAAGVVVGYNHLCDVGLVRITDQGPWPHVAMGDSTRLRPGDQCLFAGYGPRDALDRQPLTRWSSVAAPSAVPWNHLLETDPTTPFVGGDSGGGVFDGDGHLVALHKTIGRRGKPHTNPRIELIRRHWDELHEPYEQSASSPLDGAGADHRSAADGTRGSVVEVLDGEKVVALGTVVDRDGKILTLANVLPEPASCRLPDGRVLAATVVRLSREHNLAVLKIEAAGLATRPWSRTVSPPVGTLVAISTHAGPAATGVVSHPTVSIPAERGALWANVRDSPRGLEVADVFQRTGPSPLRQEDILLSIDDQQTPNRDAYLTLWQRETGAFIAGDRVRVVVTREGKKVELRQVLGPPNWPRPDGQSPRCSGFASAYSVAVDAEPPLGGPVLDRTGGVLGVAIAWRARGWLLVLPTAVAKAVADG